MDFCTTAVVGFLCLLVIGGCAGVWWAVRGRSTATSVRPRFPRCPGCGAPLTDGPACGECGLRFDSGLAERLHAVRIARREVRRLLDEGHLDAETADRVSEQLSQRLKTLAEPKRPREKPSTPPPLPEPPPLREVTSGSSPRGVRPTYREPVVETPPPPPAEPRQTWGEALGQFLQDRNILWGELAGGLLIVGCSIALVLSLWRTLESLPYFTFLLSAGITGAIFGAGYYTFHHWRLAGTSRALLAIALLLSPLNLLLLADTGRTDLVDAGVKVVAVVAFVWLVRRAGRDLLGDTGPLRPWLLALAVVAVPASLIVPGLPPRWLPLAGMVAATVGAIRLARRASLDGLLMFVGLAAFALFGAWGFSLSRTDDLADALRTLSLPAVIASMPILVAGLLVQRRVDESPGLRAIGTGVGVAGLIVMFLGLVLAWPNPMTLTLSAAVASACVAAVAWRDDVPWLHLGAIPPAMLALVLGVYGVAGQWGTDAALLLGQSLTAVAMVGGALLLYAGSEIARRRGRDEHGRIIAIGAGGIAVVALFLATIWGDDRPDLAAATTFAAAIGFVAASHRGRVVGIVGTWLILVGSLWALQATLPDDRGEWGPILAGLSLVLAVLAVTYRRDPLFHACRDVAGATAVVAALIGIGDIDLSIELAHRGTLFLVAATAFILATAYRARGLTWAASAIFLVGLVEEAARIAPLDDRWPLLLALVVHATFATAAALLLPLADTAVLRRRFLVPLRHSAYVTATLALPMLIWPLTDLAVWWAGFAAVVALLWVAFALAWRERGTFAVAQVVATWGAVLLAFAWADGRDILRDDPRAIHAGIIAVSAMCLLLTAARRLAPRMFDETRPRVDQLAFAIAIGVQVCLAIGYVVPGVMAELLPNGDLRALRMSTTPGGTVVAAWLAFAALGLVWPVTLFASRRTGIATITGLLLAVVTALLMADGFAADLAVASALRWGLAYVFVVGSLLVPPALSFRRGRVMPGVWHGSLIALAVVVMGLTAQVALLGFAGLAPSGPRPGTFFRDLGWTASVMTPLVLVVAGLTATAWRERLASYAYAAGWVLVAAVAGGYALSIVVAGPMTPTHQRETALLAVASLTLWSLAWLAFRHRVPGRSLLPAHVVTCMAGLSAIVLPVLFTTMIRPQGPADFDDSLVGWLGLPLLIVVASAATWMWPQARSHVLGWSSLVLGAIAAGILDDAELWRPWRGYHALEVTWAVAGVGFAVTWLNRSRELRYWLVAFAGLVTLLGVRAGWTGPGTPWSSAGPVMLAAMLMGLVAWRSRGRVEEYVAGTLVVIASALTWVAWGPDRGDAILLTLAIGFAAAGVLTRLLSGDVIGTEFRLWWTRLGNLAQASTPTDPTVQVRRDNAPPFAFVAAVFAVLLLYAGLAPAVAAEVEASSLLAAAVLCVGVACGDLYRDPRNRSAGAGVWLVGFAGVSGLLSALAYADALAPAWTIPHAPVWLSMYLIAANLIPLAGDRRGPTAAPWFVPLQLVGGAIVIALAVRFAVSDVELEDRSVGVYAGAMLVIATWAMTRRRDILLAAALLPLILLAWAIPDPAGSVPWLHRHAGAFVALAVAATAYLAGSRSDHRRVGAWVGLAALVMLGVVLAQEILHFDPVSRRTPLHLVAVVGMFVGIALLTVQSLRLALRPDRDPLGPTAGRTGYVYLAEALLVLFFVHLRLNVPEAFRGEMVKYWTFIVMGLAFVGVGVAETFARRGLSVLAKPLLRTGSLLPLIPLLAFWAKPPAALLRFADESAPGLRPMLGYLEKLPQHFDSYAVLWFLAGLLYGLVALARRSFGWGLLGALATNAGVWALLAHHQVPAAVHPQAWAIPLALVVLISEHVNRSRLRANTASGLRYLGVSMIYVASASDLFIAGVGQSLWLPVILAVLCLVGIAAGVALRVRAFLFLGFGFLLLDVFSMIWHAAVDRDQTWVWYVSGIVLGVIILAIFAVLEKRRDDVRQVVGKLRDWR